MSELTVPMKRNAQVLDEAAAWFVEFAEGDVPVAAREAFSQWLKASPEHVRAYLQIAGTFDDLGHLKPHQSGEIEALIEAALADGNIVELNPRSISVLDAETPAEVESSGPAIAIAHPRRGRAPVAWAAAASLVALTLLAVWHTWVSGIYTTGIGEQRIVNLADGSTIELNADSRVRVRLAVRGRFVELLAGQALFHVAKDPRRPFIVESNGTTVRAVGTQFDVNREAMDTVVTVLEGRVEVVEAQAGSAAGDASRPSAAPLYLSAGERVIVTAQAQAPPRATRADVGAATAWTERKLVFSSSSLIDVASEYNRYHEKRLRVADPKLSDFKISGVFSAADATSLIAFLRAQPNIDVQETGSEIVLKAK